MAPRRPSERDLPSEVSALLPLLDSVEFRTLPRAKLRAWLEDELVLDPSVNITQGEANFSDFFTDTQIINTIQQFIDDGDITTGSGDLSIDSPVLSIPGQAGWGLPVPLIWDTSTDTNLSNGRVYFFKFECPADANADGLTLHIPSRTGTGQELDVGIYNSGGTSKLASSGLTVVAATGAPYLQSFTFTGGGVPLTKGTVYRVAVCKLSGGNYATVTVSGASTAFSRWHQTAISDAQTAANALYGHIDYTVPPTLALPADLTAGIASTTSNGPVPLLALQTS